MRRRAAAYAPKAARAARGAWRDGGGVEVERERGVRAHGRMGRCHHPRAAVACDWPGGWNAPPPTSRPALYVCARAGNPGGVQDRAVSPGAHDERNAFARDHHPCAPRSLLSLTSSTAVRAVPVSSGRARAAAHTAVSAAAPRASLWMRSIVLCVSFFLSFSFRVCERHARSRAHYENRRAFSFFFRRARQRRVAGS